MGEKTKRSKAEKVRAGLDNTMSAVVRHFFVLPGDKGHSELKAAFDAFFSDAFKGEPKAEESEEIGKSLGMGALMASALLDADDWGYSFPQQNRPYCNGISKEEASINATYRSRLLEEIEKVISYCPAQEGPDGSRLTHRKRRQALDRCLKLLTGIGPFEKGSDFENSLNRLLARAYLYRGSLIRIKGYSIPVKKVEAIQKAAEAIQNISDLTPEDIILKGQIYLALEEIGGTPTARGADKVFLDAAICLYEMVEKDPELASSADDIFLHNAELGGEPWGLEEIVKSEQTDALSKARAALFIQEQKQNVGRYVKDAILRYKRHPFTSPCWRQLTHLIHQMASSGANGWKDLALNLWQACYARETMTLHNTLIRWYWSHQQDVYDLAFFAASDPAKRVEIADSLKGRTALHRQVLEKLANGNADIEKFVNEENDGYLGRYIKNFQPEAIKGERVPRQKLPFDQLPDDWMAVHFYVSNGYYDMSLKDCGYAMIYDGKTKVWREKTFKADPIWNVFQNWQEAYASYSRKEESAPEMLELCRTLGEELGFLFDEKVFEPGRPVLFVPFGFLHRVPLHMAVTKGKDEIEDIWAENHPSMFLPSWPPKDRLAADSKAEMPGIDILLRNFEEHQNRYNNLIEKWDNRFCKVKCPVSALLDMKKEFSLGQNGCVNHLFVFTHGLSHTIDPYASSLTFADDDLRLRQLLSSDQASLDISGAGVLLGACEADMMPPQLTIVDEHLSFSTAFLEKGASQVLSGLYQVFDTRLKELAMALKTNNVPLYQALWAWHERKCRGFGEQLREKLFFEIAPFRVLGYPRKEQRNPMQTGPTDE